MYGLASSQQCHNERQTVAHLSPWHCMCASRSAFDKKHRKTNQPHSKLLKWSIHSLSFMLVTPTTHRAPYTIFESRIISHMNFNSLPKQQQKRNCARQHSKWKVKKSLITVEARRVNWFVGWGRRPDARSSSHQGANDKKVYGNNSDFHS